jgi:class 3 adenylate cyclase
LSETRKIAAILVADVVGYSRLAGVDEDGTLARLRALRYELIDPAVDAHCGRIAKRTGDGLLVEFRSVVDAVRCAIEVTLGAKPSNASMLDGQRPLAREAVCAAYAQVRRTAAIKASPFARRVYMRRSTAGDGCEAESLLAERDRPPILGVCHGRDQESRQARHNPQ